MFLIEGKPDWWKCREAAITCIGHISEGFSKVQGDENQPPMQAARFLEALFENDVGAADPCPYLVGRGLSIAGRLAGFIPQNRVQNYMQAAVLGRPCRLYAFWYFLLPHACYICTLLLLWANSKSSQCLPM